MPNKGTVNFWMDIVSFFVFMMIVGTGIVLKWILPSRHGEGGGGWKGGGETAGDWAGRWFLGVHRSGWVDIHFWLAVILVGLIAVHIVLHWSWIVCSLKAHFLKELGPSSKKPC